jgi:hypothetical protein
MAESPPNALIGVFVSRFPLNPLLSTDVPGISTLPTRATWPHATDPTDKQTMLDNDNVANSDDVLSAVLQQRWIFLFLIKHYP